MKDKIELITNKIQPYYAYGLFFATQFSVLMSIFFYNYHFKQGPDANIVLQSVLYFLAYAISNVFLFVPIIISMLIVTMMSFMAAFSIPTFLFFSLFQHFGASNIDLWHFGFLNTLLVCIIITPVGILNLISIDILYKITQE